MLSLDKNISIYLSNILIYYWLKSSHCDWANAHGFKSSFKISSLIYYGVLMIFSVLGGIIGKNYQEENDAE